MTAVKRVPAGSNSDIQAVSRVGQILAQFGPHTAELTTLEIADRLGLNRTTAYRYCTSLVAAGILERGRERTSFALGSLMLHLGMKAVAARRVVGIAPPRLARLSAAARATAVLSLWASTRPIVALAHEDSERTVLVTVRAGALLDTYSAQMRVFLAYLPDPHLIERVTGGLGAAERSDVEAAVYMTRRTGHCVVRMPSGILSAAAPVFDERGIAATVAVIAGDPHERFAEDSPALTHLLHTAEALTEALGGGQRVAAAPAARA